MGSGVGLGFIVGSGIGISVRITVGLGMDIGVTVAVVSSAPRLQLIPRMTRAAGLELGSGMYVNVAAPKDIAKAMR